MSGQILPDADDTWSRAKEWFNGMNTDSRNQMILVLYKLCLSTRDLSHEKLIGSLNAQWNEKFSKQMEHNKQLTLENEVLSKNQETGINIVVNRMNQLETNLSNSVNCLTSKITPSVNGKLGEDYIDHLLSKIPNSSLTNVTQSKGGGDFLFVIGDIKIMIESKNWTNSSIKSSPKELENFRKMSIEAKEEKGIDFSIMALHRVTDLKGKSMDIEMEMTNKGSMILLYVTNLFNHPERILYAIDAGILLLKQQSHYAINKDNFVYQINGFMKCMDLIEKSIRDRTRIIKDLQTLTKNDTEQVTKLRNMIKNIVLDETCQNSISDKVVDYYCELIQSGVKKITKNILETKCLENNIPARHVREMGGIKAIKTLAFKKMKLISGPDPETGSEIGSEPETGSEIGSESVLCQ